MHAGLQSGMDIDVVIIYQPASCFGKFLAVVNLALGAAELGRLVEVFGGRRAPAIAAYNAGEMQAKLWLDHCGPGCTDALYLLNISFRTTRSYTAGVMAAANNYAELYSLNGEVHPSGKIQSR